MAQTTTGWRAVFSVPAVYRAAQSGIGSPRVRRALVEDYLKPRVGDCVLDIGCGTGDLAEYFPDCSYVGYDLSEAYIAAAREAYGASADFLVGSVGQSSAEADGSFDLAVSKGVLHHLDDDDALSLFAEAHSALRPGGRLVTVDPCLVDGQSRVARALISRDRGNDVRSPDGYRRLAEVSFGAVRVDVRHDLLRLPYSHAILVCIRD